MKQTFEDMKIQTPYKESEEYLDSLIQRATDKAISAKKENQSSHAKYYAAAAAVIAVMTSAAVLWTTHSSPENIIAMSQDVSPVDEFLDNLSDDDVQMIALYEVEDIPDY